MNAEDCPICPMLATDRDDALTEVDALRAQVDDCHAIINVIVAQVERDRPVIEAARAHRPDTVEAIDYRCENGDCDHDDECPLRNVEVCRACFALASEIDDERLPDAVLARNCPVCAAVVALDSEVQP